MLASRNVNANSNNTNFNVRNVNSNGNLNNNNLCNVNSNGNTNTNDNSNGLRPASINCGYAIKDCIRDNIETDYVL